MMHSALIYDCFPSLSKSENPILSQVFAVLIGVLGLALMAQMVIPLPFTPVPITGQTLGILVIAGAYGLRLGSITSLSYLALGSMGAPIFADQSGGISVVFGATGGYLIGFIAAAAIIGMLSDRGWDRSIGRSILMFTLGHSVIFSFGLLWLAQVAPDLNVWQAGLIPFIPGAIVKTLIATGLFPTIWKMRSRLS